MSSFYVGFATAFAQRSARLQQVCYARGTAQTAIRHAVPRRPNTWTALQSFAQPLELVKL
jgi:hypothetical protein